MLIRSSLLMYLLCLTACSGLKLGHKKIIILSCEEKAQEKSLEYIEQQYRCRGEIK